MRRFLIRAAAVLAAVAIAVAVAVTVPLALLASAGSLLAGSWCWYRATVVREARGGHLYCPNGRAMTESWKS